MPLDKWYINVLFATCPRVLISINPQAREVKYTKLVQTIKKYKTNNNMIHRKECSFLH